MNTQKTYQTYHDYFSNAIGQIINFPFILDSLIITSLETAFNYFYSNDKIINFIEAKSLANDQYYYVLNNIQDLMQQKANPVLEFGANFISNLTTILVVNGFNQLNFNNILCKNILGAFVKSTVKYSITGNYDLHDILFGVLSSVNAITREENHDLFEEIVLDPPLEDYIMT
jgi:hypothetical protein